MINDIICKGRTALEVRPEDRVTIDDVTELIDMFINEACQDKTRAVLNVINAAYCAGYKKGLDVNSPRRPGTEIEP